MTCGTRQLGTGITAKGIIFVSVLGVCIYCMFKSFPSVSFTGVPSVLTGYKNEDVENRNHQRLRQVNAACSTTTNSAIPLGKSTLNRILVNEEHRLLYCAIPKVASTNWKRLFLLMEGMTEEDIISKSIRIHQNPTIKTLDQFSNEEIQHRLQNYYKFMFVRNPWERLVSCFVDKFENNSVNAEPFREMKSATIMRQKYTKADEQFPRFSGFAEFLTEEHGSMTFGDHQTEMFENTHWVTYNDLCNPCVVKYDFIGELKTLQSDTSFVLRKTKVNITLPDKRRLHEGSTTSRIHEYFSKIDSKLIQKLLAVYLNDIDMFGYPHDPLAEQ